MGFADYALIIFFGAINTLIAYFYFKIGFSKSIYNGFSKSVFIGFLRSVFIGFLISSAGLVFSYLLWIPISNFNFSVDLIILGIISNVIFQTLSWLLVEEFIVKRNYIKTIPLFVSMTFVTFISFNLNDYWKFEKYYNWNKRKNIIIEVTNSETGKFIVGDSIELSAERERLYGLRSYPPIKKTITDENGISQFEIYLNNEHQGRIWRKGKYYDYFEINPKKIIEVDTLKVKTTANNV